MLAARRHRLGLLLFGAIGLVGTSPLHAQRVLDPYESSSNSIEEEDRREAAEMDREDRQRQATLTPEQRARALDADFDRCDSDACRWTSARAAAKLASTAARRKRVADLRTDILKTLTDVDTSDEPLLVRLKRARGVLALTAAVGDIESDVELATKAATARSWARAERAKVRLIGADSAIASELLGGAPEPEGPIGHTTLGSLAVYWVLRNGRCVGVYLTGSEKGSRQLDSGPRAAVAVQLLSQAVGHDASVRPSKGTGSSATISKWTESGVPIVARWSDGSLMELRIGDAKP